MTTVLVYSRPAWRSWWWMVADEAFKGSNLVGLSEFKNKDDINVMDRFYRQWPRYSEEYDFSQIPVEQVWLRCRLLNKLPKTLALRMIACAWQAINEILDEVAPQYVLSMTIDSYVMDLLSRAANLRGIRFIGVSNCPIPGYSLVSERGEHNFVREPSAEEVDHVQKMILADDFKPKYMIGDNRCFDQRVPEEINRKIVDHLSDINLPITEHARRYLINEGLRPETVIKSGSPMKEILEYYREKILKSDVLDNLMLKSGQFFVVSAHREENVDSEENFGNLLASLTAIAKKYDMPLIISTHPRTRKKLEALGSQEFDSRLHFMKPLGFFDYVKLQMEAKCVISDSGTITEESSILNFPAITIRQAHERPEGMDEGVLIMTGLTPERVLQSIDMVTSQFQPGGRTFKTVQDYDVDNFSKKITRIIMSYTDYVNRTVWHK